GVVDSRRDAFRPDAHSEIPHYSRRAPEAGVLFLRGARRPDNDAPVVDRRGVAGERRSVPWTEIDQSAGPGAEGTLAALDLRHAGHDARAIEGAPVAVLTGRQGTKIPNRAARIVGAHRSPEECVRRHRRGKSGSGDLPELVQG